MEDDKRAIGGMKNFPDSNMFFHCWMRRGVGDSRMRGSAICDWR